MTRRGFLRQLFATGVGAGAVALYPASTLDILERIFHRPKTSVVSEWEPPTPFACLMAMARYEDRYEFYIRDAEGMKYIRADFNPLEDIIRFGPYGGASVYNFPTGFEARLTKKQIVAINKLDHFIVGPA